LNYTFIMVGHSSVATALFLTGLGALGTAIGGLLVVVHPQMSFARLGLLQGFAGGLMLSISMVDLLPSALNELGFSAANLWFFGGVAFFAAVVALLPEPQLTIPPPKPTKQKGTAPNNPSRYPPLLVRLDNRCWHMVLGSCTRSANMRNELRRTFIRPHSRPLFGDVPVHACDPAAAQLSPAQ
jgi:zinc transporter ZupT